LNKPIDLQKQHIETIASIPSIPGFGFNNVMAWDPIRMLARKMPLAARCPMRPWRWRGLQFLPNR